MREGRHAIDGRGDGAPILFLDVDGVLNERVFVASRRWGGTYGMVDRARVAMLNDVAARTGCLVVVSSTWRSDEGFRAGLRRRGVRLRYHRDWRTGRLAGPDAGHRGSEVAEWLSRNPVAKYAIVDDGSDFLADQLGRLVQTDYATGLLPSHAEALVTLLAG